MCALNCKSDPSHALKVYKGVIYCTVCIKTPYNYTPGPHLNTHINSVLYVRWDYLIVSLCRWVNSPEPLDSSWFRTFHHYHVRISVPLLFFFVMSAPLFRLSDLKALDSTFRPLALYRFCFPVGSAGCISTHGWNKSKLSVCRFWRRAVALYFFPYLF